MSRPIGALSGSGVVQPVASSNAHDAASTVYFHGAQPTVGGQPNARRTAEVRDELAQGQPAHQLAERADQPPVAPEAAQARRVGERDPRLQREDGATGAVGLDAEAKRDLGESRPCESSEFTRRPRGRCPSRSAATDDRFGPGPVRHLAAHRAASS